MAMSEEELIRLVLEVEGKEQVDKVVESYKEFSKTLKDGEQPIEEAKKSLNELQGDAMVKLEAEIVRLNDKLKELQSSFEVGSISREEFVKGFQATSSELAGVQKVVNEIGGDPAAGIGAAGFAGLAIKAERAGLALATGTNLMRAGPMLESLSLALGGPAGLGLAIGALAIGFETILPKISKFFNLLDTEKLKEAAEHMQKLADESKRLADIKSTAEEEKEKGIKGLLKEMPEAAIKTGIDVTVRAEALAYEKAQAEETAKQEMIPGTDAYNLRLARGGRPIDVGATARAQMAYREPALKAQAEAMFIGLNKAEPQAIGEVGAMARRRPEFFPTDTAGLLEELTPEAQEADRAALAKIDEDEATRVGNKEARLKRAHDAEVFGRQQKQKRKRQTASLEKVTKEAVDAELAQEKQEEADKKEKVDADNLGYKYAREVDEKNERDEKRRKDRDDREAERRRTKQVREGTPEAIGRRGVEFEKNAMLGAVQQETAGMGYYPSQQVDMANQMLKQVNSGEMMARMMQGMISAVEMKIMNDFTDTVATTLGRGGGY